MQLPSIHPHIVYWSEAKAAFHRIPRIQIKTFFAFDLDDGAWHLILNILMSPSLTLFRLVGPPVMLSRPSMQRCSFYFLVCDIQEIEGRMRSDSCVALHSNHYAAAASRLCPTDFISDSVVKDQGEF